MDDEIAPQREKAEQIARVHLQKKGLLKAGYRDAQPPEDDDSVEEESRPRAKKTKGARIATPATESSGRRVCSDCETSNEPDATFCKKCGARVGPDDDEADEERAANEASES